MFNVESNIPMPSGTRQSKYPFRSMKVGDSFALPAELEKTVRASSRAYALTNGGKFSIKQDGDGYRCWRIA